MLAVRRATRDDVATILRLIRALAVYEREPDAAIATEADLLRDGFPADGAPKFRVLLAEWDGVTCGFGIRDSSITMLETARTSFTKKCLGVFSNKWNVSFCQLRNISSYTAIWLYSCIAIPCTEG